MANFKFQNYNHFINYINKNIDISDFIESSNEERKTFNDQLLFIFNEGRAEQFSWFLKTQNDFKLNKQSFDVFNEIKFEKNDQLKLYEHSFKDVLNLDEIVDFLSPINYSGVYVFTYSEQLTLNDTRCLYIGFSQNLFNRVPSSFRERNKHIKDSFYMHVVKVDNKTDAAMLELLLINSLCPSLNGSMSFSERPQFFNISQKQLDGFHIRSTKIIKS